MNIIFCSSSSKFIYYLNFHLETNEGRLMGLFSGMTLCSRSPALFEQKISLKLPRRRLHLDLLGSCRVFELCLLDNKDKPPLQRLLRRKPPNKSSGDRKLMANRQQTMVIQNVKLIYILCMYLYSTMCTIYIFREAQQNHNGNAFKLVSLSQTSAHSRPFVVVNSWL